MYYLYEIRNSKSNTKYFGITNNIANRWRSHKSCANSGRKTPLYDAMRSYGIDCFSIHELDSFLTREEACLSEIIEIDNARINKYRLYNLADGGDGGHTVTCPVKKEEWKAKLKKARAGRKPAKGMKHTKENKELFSKVSKEYWDSQETYDPQEVVKLSFKQAKEVYGISKTHYYRLRKRVAINDSN